MEKYLVLISSILLSHFLAAQTLIKAGDPGLRYELVKPSTELKKIQVLDSSGKVLGSFLSQDIITVDSAKGILVRTQSNILPDGRLLKDSTVALLKGLKPVRMRMVTFPHFMSMLLDFQPSKVHAISDRGGKTRDTVHTMAEGYFDSNLIEYVMGLLPYKKGMHVILNAYTFERDGMDPYEVEYVGEDIMEAGGGAKISCYLARTGNSGKPLDSFIWVEKQTGKVIKRVMPVGKNFYVITRA